MVDYEKMSTSEVQKLARQGDKEALYEMVWRLELVSGGGNDLVENCAWQDYWFEKAADAGHIDAKSRYARSLLDRIMNAEDRQKAMRYFESLVADFDAGKLSKDQELDGIIAKMWLGIMLCEGYHTPRDAKRGADLIQSAHLLTKGFEEFGFKSLSKIGEIYATGLAQECEDPTTYDLDKAIKYLTMAVERFKPENDPNHRGYKQINEDLIRVCKERKNSVVRDFADAEELRERRKKMMEISPAAAERVKADKAALARLRERLKREGW